MLPSIARPSRASLTMFAFVLPACAGDAAGPPAGDDSGPPAVASVEVTPPTATLSALEATVELTATARDAGGNVISGTTFTWSSSDEAVADVSADGVVTAIDNGGATLTATAEGHTGSAAVTVAQEVAAFELTPALDTVASGSTLALEARASDANGHVVADAAITWSSADTSRAAVSAGVVTGKLAGEVAIAATTGAFADTAVVTIVPGALASLEVAPAEKELGAIDDTVHFTVVARDAAGNSVPVSPTWTTGDPALVDVDANGIAAARGNGATFVAATAEGVADTAAVVVQQVPASVAISGRDTLNAIGDTLVLTATAEDRNGHPVDGAAFTWSSLAPGVATVDGTGEVVSVTTGSAPIVAAAGDGADTLTVVSRQVLASVAVVNATSGAAVDTLPWMWQGPYEATAADSNDVEITGATFTWSSADTSLVKVDAAGEVTVVYGFDVDVLVTATTDEVSGAATVHVAPGDPTVALESVHPSPLAEDAVTTVTIEAMSPVPAGMTGFLEGATVYITDSAGTPQLAVNDVTFVDVGRLDATVTTQAGDVGSYDVIVANPDGTWGILFQALEVAELATDPILVVTEIMVDPTTTTDADGEWFEIYNATAAPVDLAGLVVRDDGGETFTVSGSLIVPGGGIVVFGRNADGVANGGVALDYVYGGAMNLGNTGDEIELVWEGTVLDRVVYTGLQVTSGAALSLSANAVSATLNDQPENWCAATSPYNAEDFGTPGAPNPAC